MVLQLFGDATLSRMAGGQSALTSLSGAVGEFPSVQRVQNIIRWQYYSLRKSELKDPAERHLFHGTSGALSSRCSPRQGKQIPLTYTHLFFVFLLLAASTSGIVAGGFEPLRSGFNAAVYGDGTYFAVNSL